MTSDDNNAPRFVRSDEPADVSVIIVNYNTAHLLERCIGKLRGALQGLSVSLVIVDNASRDDSAAFIRQHFPDCLLLANDVNVGFGRANNQALPHCRGRYVLLLNTDAFVFPDTLASSVAYMDRHPGCGVLGVKSVDETGREMFSGRSFPTPWKSFVWETGLFKRWASGDDAAKRLVNADGAIQCDWVVGCYYMVRRDLIQQLNLFDPRYFLYLEEVDHCRTVQAAGWTVDCLMDVCVIHVGGASAESEGPLSGAGRQLSALQMESTLLYFRKHGGWWGLMQATGLALLTDLVQATKWVLKRRPLGGLAMYGRRAALLCELLLQTRGGLRPTR